MPELPEVERAASLLRTIASGRTITEVVAVQDEIVFCGVTHKEFASEICGRRVVGVGRYGKVFYVELEGEGRMPVLHFGMTGMLQVKGEKAIHYREAPRKPSTDWPPRFMKFIFHLRGDDGSIAEVAFLDARRLGRIRMCASPTTEPPIVNLGFDPVLCMPLLEDYKQAVLRRSCPIKALLLDQSFNAGVGNWVADEILYHSQIHPERRANCLSDGELEALHKYTREICRIAVEANADDSKFPDNWLFKHRWSKGKKAKHSLLLPSGGPATIKWITVRGRTSAYVSELQRNMSHSRAKSKDSPMDNKAKGKRKIKYDQSDQDSGSSESDLTPLEESDYEIVVDPPGDNGLNKAVVSSSKFFAHSTSRVKRDSHSLVVEELTASTARAKRQRKLEP